MERLRASFAVGFVLACVTLPSALTSAQAAPGPYRATKSKSSKPKPTKPKPKSKSTVAPTTKATSKASVDAIPIPANLPDPFLLREKGVQLEQYEDFPSQSIWLSMGLLSRGEERVALRTVGGTLGKNWTARLLDSPNVRKVTVGGVQGGIFQEGPFTTLRWQASDIGAEAVGTNISEAELLKWASSIVVSGSNGDINVQNLPSDVKVATHGRYETLVGSRYVLRFVNEAKTNLIMVTVTRSSPELTDLKALIYRSIPKNSSVGTLYFEESNTSMMWQASPTASIEVGVVGGPPTEEIAAKIVSVTAEEFDAVVAARRTKFRNRD